MRGAGDLQRPYLIVELASEKEARLIGSRAILVKNIWRYWASADTYDQLHEQLREPEQRVHWVRHPPSRIDQGILPCHRRGGPSQPTDG